MMSYPRACAVLSIALALAAPLCAAYEGPPPAADNLKPTASRICGWFENPTPANVFLRDREREWTVGVQGGYQAEGLWPEFADEQWVRNNNNYGYGCACVDATLDLENDRIVAITGSFAQPLDVCRGDQAVKHYEPLR